MAKDMDIELLDKLISSLQNIGKTVAAQLPKQEVTSTGQAKPIPLPDYVPPVKREVEPKK